MKIGDVVKNIINVGLHNGSFREPGYIGIVVDVGLSWVAIGAYQKPIRRTDITVMLNDGSVATYDSAGFSVISYAGC